MEYLLDALASTIPACSLEPGVQTIVGILNGKGLVTTMSCEGDSPRPRGRGRAWIDLCPAAFKAYMMKRSKAMEAFLMAGEGRWQLKLTYFAKSRFPGLGARRPRLKTMRRHVEIELTPRIVLDESAWEPGRTRKSISMRSMERAAAKLL